MLVSLYSAHQDASNDVHFDLEVTKKSRDLRSTDDLDLMWSRYTHFNAYQREDLDGALSFALAQLIQKIAKHSLVFKYRHFYLFDPCDVIWGGYPPLPVGTKVAQTPVGARVNKIICNLPL